MVTKGMSRSRLQQWPAQRRHGAAEQSAMDSWRKVTDESPGPKPRDAACMWKSAPSRKFSQAAGFLLSTTALVSLQCATRSVRNRVGQNEYRGWMLLLSSCEQGQTRLGGPAVNVVGAASACASGPFARADREGVERRKAEGKARLYPLPAPHLDSQ